MIDIIHEHSTSNYIENIENISPITKIRDNKRWKQSPRINKENGYITPKKRICIDLTHEDDNDKTIEIITNIPSADLSHVDMDGLDDNSVNSPSASISFQTINTDYYLYFCPFCNEILPNLKYPDHIIKHFMLTAKSKGSICAFTKCLSCLQCVHTDPSRHISSDSCNNFLRNSSSSKKRNSAYRCQICFEYSSRFRNNLLKHYEDEHVFQNFLICKYCDKVFDYSVNDVINYSSTGKVIVHTANFLEHLYNHLEYKVKQCTLCYRKFISDSDLQMHLLMCHRVKKSLRQISHRPFTNVLKYSSLCEYLEVNCFWGLSCFTPKLHLPLNCIECGQMCVNVPIEHFKAGFKCRLCRFSSNCILHAFGHMYFQHKHIIQDFMANLPNTTKRKLQKYLNDQASRYWSFVCSPYLMVCGCGYKSCRTDLVIQHLSTAGCGFYSVKLVERAILTLPNQLERKAFTDTINADSVRPSNILETVGLRRKV